MGKVMVVGKAEHRYVPDYCEISLGIEIVRPTSVEAARVANEQCERLLKHLEGFGIDASDIEICSDRITIHGRYESDGREYESNRLLLIRAKADTSFVNAMRSIVEQGFENTTLSASYHLSNEDKLRGQLLTEAIADSRKKADMLASSMNERVLGFESANLSGLEDIYDLSDEASFPCVSYKDGLCECHEPLLSDKLKPEPVGLSAEVKIVWLIG